MFFLAKTAKGAKKNLFIKLGVTQLNFFAAAETPPRRPHPPSPLERGPGGEVSLGEGAGG